MHTCINCGNKIADNEEQFFVGCWERSKTKSTVVHYHRKCFEEIAGEEFVKTVKTGISENVANFVNDSDCSDPKIRWRYMSWKDDK